MKKNCLTLLACLAICSCLFAHNGDPDSPIKNSTANTSEIGLSLKDIFLSDYEGVTLFIDFQAVKDAVVDVNVRKKEEVIMHDDVRTLPGSTIYELDLSNMKTGNYLVELKTEQGICIQKELTIN
ncbi:MAG: DUF3244 domain-containing protein [Saprospiraceae bacterium]